MAKSKYTPDTVKTILDAIAQIGTDQAGYESAGVSKDTFYEWLNRYPDFSDSVIEARRQFQDLCPESLIAAARKALADQIHGRATKTETTVKKKRVRAKPKDDEPEPEDGADDFLDVEEEVTTKTMTLLPPKWAIERVLGKSDHEKHLSALYALIKKIMALEVGELGEIKSMIQADLETLLLEVGVEEVRSILGIAQAGQKDDDS